MAVKTKAAPDQAPGSASGNGAVDQTVWGIHAGIAGEAHGFFMDRGVIAIGWPKCGDVRRFKDVEALKQEIQRAYPEKKPGAIPVDAGQLNRFMNEMKVGDLVVYPSTRVDRKVNIGRVEGPHQYQPDWNAQYPNIRPVKWLGSYPRTSFSQGALYEIGSAISFFQVKSYADEFKAATGNRPIQRPVVDETVGLVTEDIEVQTRDFIIKKLSASLKGLPLEDFVVHLLQCMGYRARRTPNGEPSVDIIAHKDELGFEPPIIKVQVKSSDDKISDKDVSALYGKLGKDESGLVVALSDFHRDVRHFASSKGNLRLIDGDELVDLIFQHYEKFDAKYKTILPLKKVYVPEPAAEEGAE